MSTPGQALAPIKARLEAAISEQWLTEAENDLRPLVGAVEAVLALVDRAEKSQGDGDRSLVTTSLIRAALSEALGGGE